jgi:hypothetical protein
MEEKRNAYMVMMGKPEGKRPLGRHIFVGGRIMLRGILEKYDEDMD